MKRKSSDQIGSSELNVSAKDDDEHNKWQQLCYQYEQKIKMLESKVASLESHHHHSKDLRNMIINGVHDLKTPLSAFVSGLEYSSLMTQELDLKLRGRSTTGASNYVTSSLDKLQIGLENVKHIGHVMMMSINRCVDLTKTCTGDKLEPRFDTTEVLETMNAAFNCVRDIHSNVHILFEPIPQSICSHVVTDSTWLQENTFTLMLHVLNNYTKHGKIKLSLSLANVLQSIQPMSHRQGESKRAQSKLMMSLMNLELDEEEMSSEKGSSTAECCSNTEFRMEPEFDVVELQSSLSYPCLNSAGSNVVNRFIVNKQQLEKLKINQGRETVDFDKNSDNDLYLRVEVAHSGLKLDDSMVRGLFRSIKYPKVSTEGSGLDLFNLTKRVESLGGYFGVQSFINGSIGTVFWFALPYRPDYETARFYKRFFSSTFQKSNIPPELQLLLQLPNNKASTSNLGSKSATPKISNAPQLGGNVQSNYTAANLPQCLNILVVDDSVPILKMTRKLLTLHGHRVEIAENGQIALKMIADRVKKSMRKMSNDDKNERAHRQMDNSTVNSGSTNSSKRSSAKGGGMKNRHTILDSEAPWSQVHKSSKNNIASIDEFKNRPLQLLMTGGGVQFNPNILDDSDDEGAASKPPITTSADLKHRILCAENLNGPKMDMAVDDDTGEEETDDYVEEDPIKRRNRLRMEMLAYTAFDVVLMDVQMPIMDGIEATRRLRQLENSSIYAAETLFTAEKKISPTSVSNTTAGVDDDTTLGTSTNSGNGSGGDGSGEDTINSSKANDSHGASTGNSSNSDDSDIELFSSGGKLKLPVGFFSQLQDSSSRTMTDSSKVKGHSRNISEMSSNNSSVSSSTMGGVDECSATADSSALGHNTNVVLITSSETTDSNGHHHHSDHHTRHHHHSKHGRDNMLCGNTVHSLTLSNGNLLKANMSKSNRLPSNVNTITNGKGETFVFTSNEKNATNDNMSQNGEETVGWQFVDVDGSSSKLETQDMKKQKSFQEEFANVVELDSIHSICSLGKSVLPLSYSAAKRLVCEPVHRESGPHSIRSKAMIITEAKPPFMVVHSNEAFSLLTGYPASHLQGRSLRLLQGAQTDPRSWSSLPEVLSNWEKKVTEVTSQSKHDVQSSSPETESNYSYETYCVNFTSSGRMFYNHVVVHALSGGTTSNNNHVSPLETREQNNAVTHILGIAEECTYAAYEAFTDARWHEGSSNMLSSTVTTTSNPGNEDQRISYQDFDGSQSLENIMAVKSQLELDGMITDQLHHGREAPPSSPFALRDNNNITNNEIFTLADLPVDANNDNNGRKRERIESRTYSVEIPISNDMANTEKTKNNKNSSVITQPTTAVDPIGMALLNNELRRGHQFVIAVSANSEKDNLQEAYLAGIDAFLPKPFTLEAFYEVVMRYRSNNSNRMTSNSISNNNLMNMNESNGNDIKQSRKHGHNKSNNSNHSSGGSIPFSEHQRHHNFFSSGSSRSINFVDNVAASAVNNDSANL